MDPWTLLVLAVIGLGIAGWFLSRKTAAQPSVGPLLEHLGPDYSVLNGVVVPTAKGLIRIDHVVVSPYGVFIIHERSEPGQVEVQPSQREWPVTHWRKRDTLYNPLWRSRQVINDLEEKLGALPMISLVVFTNARLRGPEEPALVRPHDVLRRIRSFSRPVLTAEHQQKTLVLLRPEAK